ncbi:hypothetical protein GGR53DRAFT_475016 [Hypoxylon sp. FL1150]|nr:hypothetical protein GGR53DRAFT_475016 [Hypoxylon sp. FL1150]
MTFRYDCSSCVFLLVFFFSVSVAFLQQVHLQFSDTSSKQLLQLFNGRRTMNGIVLWNYPWPYYMQVKDMRKNTLNLMRE